MFCHIFEKKKIKKTFWLLKEIFSNRDFYSRFKFSKSIQSFKNFHTEISQK